MPCVPAAELIVMCTCVEASKRAQTCGLSPAGWLHTSQFFFALYIARVDSCMGDVISFSSQDLGTTFIKFLVGLGTSWYASLAGQYMPGSILQ